MKKLKRLIFVFSIILISIIILCKNLNNMDEIFNYNWGRNIVHGNILYKDFNCIVFPTFPLIMGMILKLFGEEMIVYRIFQIIILGYFEGIALKLFSKLDLEKRFVFNFILVMLYTVLIAIFGLVEYNMVTVLLVLLMIRIELKENKRNSDFIKIGLLVGISITVKQSVGCVILLASLLYTTIEYYLSSQDDRKVFFFKRAIKVCILKILAVTIVLGILLFYLLATNSFYEFINYTILGLRSFLENEVSFFEFLVIGNFVIGVLAILMVIIFFFNLVMIGKKKERREVCLMIYGMATLVIFYPIASEYHILMGFFPNFLLFLYFLNQKREEKFFEEKVEKGFLKTIQVSLILLIIVLGFNVVKLLGVQKYNHYRYCFIENTLDKQLENVEFFLKKYDNAYIIDTTGSFFMIPIDRYNGVFDLVNRGNLGKEGENGLIQKIEEMKNTYFLIVPSDVDNRQNPKKVIHYIEENFEYQGILEKFQIYYKK